MVATSPRLKDDFEQNHTGVRVGVWGPIYVPNDKRWEKNAQVHVVTSKKWELIIITGIYINNSAFSQSLVQKRLTMLV